MKKYILALMILSLTSGCMVNDREVEKEAIEASLTSMVDVQATLAEILTLLNQFEKDLEKKPNKETIHEYGQRIEDKWDTIEKKVESKFPEDYVIVEKSLYPLIGEAKSPVYNLDKVKSNLKESQTKLSNLQKKWQAQ
ncbi:hypothetical protein [Peribacillus alkalitolerans]|uniref:hypothetical protein n=1 Tax=Peribacillus alkalitolerans TaxID=1550385 RepID=UPI0013D77B79|nr:hypothetical protein [Peribacillus alkalitolerans]